MSRWMNVLAVSLLIGCTTVVRAGPILWVDDQYGEIGKVDAATGAVTLVGNAGVVTDDIAFDPHGHLDGIDGINLYSINTTTGAATTIAALTGPLAGKGANALVFANDGTLFGAGSGSTDLFSINPLTGATTDLGNVGKTSAGDLAFVNGKLYLTGPFGGTAPFGAISDLIQIDLNANNTVNSFTDLASSTGFINVFGLASPDNVHLYGIAGTDVLTINLTTGAGTFLSNYSGHGLSLAYGSAFITEAGFAAVPEPASLTLLGIGLAVMGGFTLRRRQTKAAAVTLRP